MFWKTNSASSSHLESLLNKEDVTLQELMDEEEILQECKSQNKRLLDFLTQTNILEELIELTTVEPVGDGNENTRYKYPNLACELLTCEVPQLTEKLAGDRALLGKLYSFLETDTPLNPLLASFFSKTFGVLIARKSEQNWYSYQFSCLQVLDFLKSKENCINLLLKHLGTSAIMDLAFKLITKVDDVDMKQSILTWLDDQKLIESIVSMLDPSVDSDRHTNAASLLCDVIRTSRDNQRQLAEKPEPDPILDRIESPDTVAQLLEHILKEPKCETSILGGISVLMTLLDCDKKDTNDVNCTVYVPPTQPEDLTPDSTEPSKVVLSTIAAILPRLKDFHNILLNPPVKPSVKTTIGVLDPPLGTTRVEVTRLLSVLVATNNTDINNELANLDTINVLLDLFFKYSWNNFLHTQVEQCLAFALNAELKTGKLEATEDNSLVAHILVKCRLLQRILEAWQENENQQTELKGLRRGYMGHLIKISNCIAQVAEKGPLGAFIKEKIEEEVATEWEEFVSTKLKEVNKTQQICLGGVHPGQSSSEDDDADYKEVPFPQDSALQQLYSGYQLQQQLASSFSEQLGAYDEDQFNDTEDILNTTVDPHMNTLTFNMNEEDLDQQAALFKQVCAQKLQTLEDDESDIWDNQMDTNGAKLIDLQARFQDNGDHSSSDEEDAERPGPEGREETHHEPDVADIWSSGLEQNVAPVVDSNPWSSDSFNLVTNSGGLGNFDAVPFVADFDFNFPPSDINTTIATSMPNDISTVPIPLDLTPNETSEMNMCEAFSNKLDELQTVQTSVGEILSCIAGEDNEDVATRMKWIANAVEQLSLEEMSELGAAGGSQNSVSLEKEDTDVSVNSRLEDSTNVGGNIADNCRLNASQGLINYTELAVSNTEDVQVSEGEGDAARVQIASENVTKVSATSVPNETTHVLNSVDDNPSVTTNGPV